MKRNATIDLTKDEDHRKRPRPSSLATDKEGKSSGFKICPTCTGNTQDEVMKDEVTEEEDTEAIFHLQKLYKLYENDFDRLSQDLKEQSELASSSSSSFSSSSSSSVNKISQHSSSKSSSSSSNIINLLSDSDDDSKQTTSDSSSCTCCPAWTPRSHIIWTQSLAKDHTHPKPLPGQELTMEWTVPQRYCCENNGTFTTNCRDCKVCAPANGSKGYLNKAKNTTKYPRIVTSRTTQQATTQVFVPFRTIAPRKDLKANIVRSHEGKILGVVLKNWDGQRGLDLANALENMMGSDVLGGGGTSNICSNALGGTCTKFCDNFIKLWPLMGSGHGGNYDGHTHTTGLPRFFLEHFVKHAATIARTELAKNEETENVNAVPLPCTTSNKGLLQIQRYVQAKAKKWHKRNASRLHPHVDKNKESDGLVVVLSLGNTVKFLLDDGNVCQHNLKYKCSMTSSNESGRRDEKDSHHYTLKGNKTEDLKTWSNYPCEFCQTIELESGDVLLFDGREDAQIAHGILEVCPNSAPNGCPDWLTDSRIGVQFRSIK